ncbi:MAG: TonB-dependent vitamin B12 receptor [Sulfuricella sp.]|nr:TonB-dependent vitamin B12 receptor [Sulfuricella sp.]
MKQRILPAALMLLGTQSLFAAPAATLDPVIVTATRTAQTADETLAAVTLLTRADIERQQAHSVIDLLRGLPGIDIVNNGGMGKTSSVLMRGAEGGHVLVLIDGVHTGSATLGSTPIEQLPIEQIERIEIVRGPRSSLYGSEAIGGVIQIFTRKGGGPLTPSLSVRVGSNRTFQSAASLSGGGDNTWYSMSMSGLDSAGFNACNGQTNVGGCFTSEPDRDGYRNLAGAARGGMRLENGAEIDVNWLRSNSKTQFDGDYVNEAKTAQQVLGGTVRYSPLAAWRLSLAAGRSLDLSDNFKNSVWMSRFDTRRDTVSLQNDLTIGASQLLTLGFDYQNDGIDSDTVYTQTSRSNRGGYAQFMADSGAHSVQASLRSDDNSQFGRRGTGSLGWGYKLSDGLRLNAAYGTAFKAPTFNDLYYPGYGNANLKPEESRSGELGLRGNQGGVNWSLNAFQTDIDNLIAFNAATFLPGNVNTARIRGLEGNAGMQVAEWRINAGLTLLDPENRSAGSYQGKRLARRAEQTLRLDLDRDIGPARIGATLIAAGERYDDLANTRKLGGYATLDLRAEYALDKEWRIQAKAVNLFDRAYETASFYNQPGRSVFLTLRYQPLR